MNDWKMRTSYYDDITGVCGTRDGAFLLNSQSTQLVWGHLETNETDARTFLSGKVKVVQGFF
jgi:hypothetical protein